MIKFAATSGDHKGHPYDEPVIFTANPVGAGPSRPRIAHMIKFTATSGDHKGRPYDESVIFTTNPRRGGVIPPANWAYDKVRGDRGRPQESP